MSDVWESYPEVKSDWEGFPTVDEVPEAIQVPSRRQLGGVNPPIARGNVFIPETLKMGESEYMRRIQGMVGVGDKIYLNVNGTVDTGFIPEMKHGLWVFDPEVGLYHRSFHSVDRSVVETPSALSSSTLTLATHNLKSGDVLVFRNTGSMTGVQLATKYYVSVQSATTVKLAISRKALQAGNTVTIGGTVGAGSVSVERATASRLR